MRIVEINMLHKGSTGKIMFSIADRARAADHLVWTFSPVVYQRRQRMDTPAYENHTYFGTRFENMLHLIADRLCCMNGCFSVLGTFRLLRHLKRIRPDVIHLHNLHNRTICLPLLFQYIRKQKIPTIWTLHDCWSMTGRCFHYAMAECEKWKSGCGQCPQIHVYPGAHVDMTKWMWKLKKQWFTSVEQMVLTVPSYWLADQVRHSFLKGYPVKVIHNGIDLDIFKPTPGTFREKNHCQDKKLVLGVAFDWTVRKGIDVFIELAKRFPPSYQLVMLGTSEMVEKQLPANILTIRQTQNQQELAEIYTAADVLINPTREDTFPTVNIEALACGTPVVTFKTGGSPEIIDASCGIVVPYNDVDAMEHAIYSVCETKPLSQADCLKRAQQYDAQSKFQEYVHLYQQFAQNE